MELDGLPPKSRKRGNGNEAFESEEEDQIYIDSKIADHELKEAERKKCLMEQKMEEFQDYLAQHKDQILRFLHLLLAAGFVAMVIAACVLNFRRAVALLVITLVTGFFLLWDWTMSRYGDRVWEELNPLRERLSRNWSWIRWLVCVLLLIFVVCWLILDTAKRGSRQLVAFGGLLLLVFFTLLFSKHPFRWRWQTLLCGLGLQFVFGLLILRTGVGLAALKWLGEQAVTFMSYIDAGCEFVFGPRYVEFNFIFKVMPTLVFLSSVISILFHLGFMPWLICKIGFLMEVLMDTSPAESMAASANLFLGMTESPLLIRPYISQLTVSEIHAMMTAGFSSVAGTVLGIYISFGVDATHLLTATVMSIPASLAIAKTFWPETEITAVTTNNIRTYRYGTSTNVFDAASRGASAAIDLVANIVVSILCFLALLAFINAALSWLGGMFDCPQLSFSLISSYVFMPLAYMMGCSWKDSFIVAELIGLKTFLNEFVAYEKLSTLIKRREAGGPEFVDNVQQYISVHSEMVATYALCGFSNFCAMGLAIGYLSALAPDRRTDISRCALRALISGSVSCFMTACIAGMLYLPDPCPTFLNSEFNNVNVTINSQIVSCCTQLFNSVTLLDSGNVTLGSGFSVNSLQSCCKISPNTHFNCSRLL